MGEKEYKDKPRSKNATKAQRAFDYFNEKGYRPAISAGIVGNLMQESTQSLDENIRNESNGAFGIAQWLGPRYDRLKSKMGDRHDTFEGQLDFIYWELKNTHKNVFEGIEGEITPEKAAVAFSNNYEKAGKHERKNNRRVKYANSIYKNAYNGAYVNQKNQTPINYKNASFYNKDGSFNTSFKHDVEVEQKKESKTKEKKNSEQSQIMQELKKRQKRRGDFLKDFSEVNYVSNKKETTSQQPKGLYRKNPVSKDYGQEKIWVFPKFAKGGEASFSKEGYKTNSPDRYKPYNLIDSGNITMKGVPHPVLGIDEKGNKKIMQPEKEYSFEGDVVFEIPLKNNSNISK